MLNHIIIIFYILALGQLNVTDGDSANVNLVTNTKVCAQQQLQVIGLLCRRAKSHDVKAMKNIGCKKTNRLCNVGP
jgi:hypothetical protein